MAGSRSCTLPPQGTGRGLQRADGDHFDPPGKEGTKEEKGTLSLLDMIRKALETASAWALSLLRVTWKVLETASSWSKAQGTLARVVGLEELVEIMPREHLAKVVTQDAHREDHRRTPQEVIARTRKQVWIPNGTASQEAAARRSRSRGPATGYNRPGRV